MRRWIVLAALVAVSACNQSSAAVTGVADVAVQSGDLPKGVQRCSASGDIDSFLNAVKSKDPSTYSSTKSEWDKANGRPSAEVVFTPQQGPLRLDTNSERRPGVCGVSHRHQLASFKDQASAEQGYTTESISSAS
jgi:hypothetical protein